MVVEDPDIAPLCAGLDRGIEMWLPRRRSLLVSSTTGRDCGSPVDAGMMHLDGVEWSSPSKTDMSAVTSASACPRSSKDAPRLCYSLPRLTAQPRVCLPGRDDLDFARHARGPADGLFATDSRARPGKALDGGGRAHGRLQLAFTLLKRAREN